MTSLPTALVGVPDKLFERTAQRLARHGLDVSWHFGRRNGFQSIPDAAKAVVVGKDFVRHADAQKAAAQARQRGLPLFYLPQRWAEARQLLEQAGLREIPAPEEETPMGTPLSQLVDIFNTEAARSNRNLRISYEKKVVALTAILPEPWKQPSTEFIKDNAVLSVTRRAVGLCGVGPGWFILDESRYRRACVMADILPNEKFPGNVNILPSAAWEARVAVLFQTRSKAAKIRSDVRYSHPKPAPPPPPPVAQLVEALPRLEPKVKPEPVVEPMVEKPLPPIPPPVPKPSSPQQDFMDALALLVDAARCHHVREIKIRIPKDGKAQAGWRRVAIIEESEEV